MTKTILFSVLVAAGCGGSTATVDDYETMRTALKCEFEVNCCQTVPGAIVYTDVSTCKAAETANNAAALATIKSGIEKGTLKFDAAQAAKCNALTVSATSSCTNTLDEMANTDDCQDIVTGIIAVGSGCGADESSSCAPGADCVGGLCRAHVPAGGVCADGDQNSFGTCADGLQCDYSGSLTCVTPKADGDDCTYSTECSSNDCESAKCSALAPQPITALCETSSE